jgi:hypothetical protein
MNTELHVPESLRSTSSRAADLLRTSAALLPHPHSMADLAEGVLDTVVPEAEHGGRVTRRQMRRAGRRARRMMMRSERAREAAAVATALAEEAALRAQGMRAAAHGKRSRTMPVAMLGLGAGMAMGVAAARRFVPAPSAMSETEESGPFPPSGAKSAEQPHTRHGLRLGNR